MYGWHGLFTMENVIVMYLSIVLDIVLGETSYKITLRYLVFLLIWDDSICGFVKQLKSEFFMYPGWLSTYKKQIAFEMLKTVSLTTFHAKII